MCVIELGQHWLKYLLVTCSAPSHCLNQSSLIINWTLKNKFKWNLNPYMKFFIMKMHFKMWSVKWQPFCPWGDEWRWYQLTGSTWLKIIYLVSWWRHQMETFSELLALCKGNSLVTGEFPSQRPVARNFDVFFDLTLNKWLSKPLRRWWFEMLLCSLWHHCNVMPVFIK